MASTPPDSLESRLDRLIGTRFRYQGVVWVLLDVLHDEQRVVLQRIGGDSPKHMQPDQFGQPSRYAAETQSLPMYDEDGSDYSAELKDVLAAKVNVPAD